MHNLLSVRIMDSHSITLISLGSRSCRSKSASLEPLYQCYINTFRLTLLSVVKYHRIRLKPFFERNDKQWYSRIKWYFNGKIIISKNVPKWQLQEKKQFYSILVILFSLSKSLVQVKDFFSKSYKMFSPLQKKCLVIFPLLYILYCISLISEKKIKVFMKGYFCNFMWTLNNKSFSSTTFERYMGKACVIVCVCVCVLTHINAFLH